MVDLAQVKNRLAQLGYEVKDADLPKLEYETQLILDYVVNYCNFTSADEIPEILDKRIIDRICAEYLFTQKNAGTLEGFDYETAIKTIKEGDTQIQFGTQSDGETPESRFDKLVDYLNRGFDKWICKWRRLKW